MNVEMGVFPHYRIFPNQHLLKVLMSKSAPPSLPPPPLIDTLFYCAWLFERRSAQILDQI